MLANLIATRPLERLSPKTTFYIAFLSLFLLGVGLRFWHLDQFNQLIFDEVYFPKFAYDYLNQAPFFHSHPPLGKLTQAAGIWIYNHLPWVNDPPIGSVALQELNAHSWRWVNASFGSLLILLVGFTVYTFTKNRLFAFLAALFITIDGSLLVASRYGLSNVQILFFGFLSMLCLAKAFTTKHHHRRWLLLCGISLGCTVSIKWNGLGYSLIAWCLFIGGTLCLYADRLLSKVEMSHFGKKERRFNNPYASLFSRIKVYEYVAFLMLLPAAIYSATWVPDLALNSRHAKYGFVGMHKQMTSYHGKRVGADAHPYCSKWYSWPLLIRPINYHFEKNTITTTEGKVEKVYRDVHLLGNPALYWLGVAALLWVFAQWLYSVLVWLRLGVVRDNLLIHSFITLGFMANFLPWMLVSRCTFFYHYQSASVFKFLALAWITTELIKKSNRYAKLSGFLIITIALVVFLYLLPIHLGLPMDKSGFYNRMWFRSWI